MPARAILDQNKTRFMMAGDVWRSAWMPISELPRQIKFYQGLHDREKAKYAKFYAPMLGQLKALDQQIKAAKP